MCFNLDNYLINGDIENIIALTEYNKEFNAGSKQQITIIPKKLENDQNQLLRFRTILKKELDQKLASFECISCHRVFNKQRGRLLNEAEKTHEAFLAFAANYQSDQYYMCREQCYKQIYIEKKVPLYSYLNNIELHSPPEEIKGLNLYETMLCELSKCFQTIVKLNPLRKTPGVDGTAAIKGLAVHLPIQFEDTHQKLTDTLPNADALNIIVNDIAGFGW
jgi:hypothetical protein